QAQRPAMAGVNPLIATKRRRTAREKRVLWPRREERWEEGLKSGGGGFSGAVRRALLFLINFWASVGAFPKVRRRRSLTTTRLLMKSVLHDVKPSSKLLLIRTSWRHFEQPVRPSGRMFNRSRIGWKVNVTRSFLIQRLPLSTPVRRTTAW